MYRIAVPIVLRSCRRYTPEAMLAEVKKFDAQRVFLALGYYQLDPENRRQVVMTCINRTVRSYGVTRGDVHETIVCRHRGIAAYFDCAGDFVGYRPNRLRRCYAACRPLA